MGYEIMYLVISGAVIAISVVMFCFALNEHFAKKQERFGVWERFVDSDVQDAARTVEILWNNEQLSRIKNKSTECYVNALLEKIVQQLPGGSIVLNKSLATGEDELGRPNILVLARMPPAKRARLLCQERVPGCHTQNRQ